MEILTLNDILDATHGKLIGGCECGIKEFNDITTDSRQAGEGVLFIPLAGERFDGHNFIASALENGASAALTHMETEPVPGKAVIKVEDTRKALGDIARYYKAKYPIPTAAITGSVGKTTTKDMIYAVLAAHFNTHKTQANYNNDIGVPLTVFGLKKEHEAAVIEMGMNHFGEIRYLAGIAVPDVAVITNIGMSHIENLGSQEGIFKAKMEIAERFSENNTLIVNGDDKFLGTVKGEKYNVVKYGMDKGNDIYAEDIKNNGLSGLEFTVVTQDTSFRAEVKQPGIHNVYNALAAIAVGLQFGETPEECVRGLRECQYTAQRLEVINKGGIEVINDCYNSSPDSIRAALGVQQLSTQPRRVAILGDVLEMGDFAKEAHYALGRDVVEKGVDVLITAGENAAEIARCARELGMKNVISYETTADVVKDISNLVKDGDSVLVKASHGMKFIDITETILKD